MTKSKTEILEDWFRRVWVEADVDAIDDLFRPDSKADGILPGFHVGPDDFREVVSMFLALVEDVQVKVEKVMEDGDWAAGLFSMKVLNPMNGEPVMCSGQLFVRFEGEKMVEVYNSFDFMSFFEQMGLLPPHSLELCLTGQRIGS